MNKKNIDHIDQLIQHSESEKRLDIRPILWDRLERQLDQKPSGRPYLRWIFGSVAATISLIAFSHFGLRQAESNTYLVEDLIYDSKPVFTRQEVEGLREYFINQEETLEVLNG